MDTSHKIKKSKDLTKENIQLLFQNYFEDPSLTVEKAYFVDLKPGDHYMSEIKTMKIEFEGPKDPMTIYIKMPIGQVRHQLLQAINWPIGGAFVHFDFRRMILGPILVIFRFNFWSTFGTLFGHFWYTFGFTFGLWIIFVPVLVNFSVFLIILVIYT